MSRVDIIFYVIYCRKMYFLNFPGGEVFWRNVLSKYLSQAIFYIFYSVQI